MSMQIDGQRLSQTLLELAKVGAFEDPRTGLTGVCRLALTDADRDGRRLVTRWFEEAGLEVRIDRIGNVYGRRAGRSAGAPVMSGSHIDSVPTGGAFDGCLGVIGALEVVRTLNDHAIETERPIEIAFFTDEEGARFGTDMLGSAVAAGRLSLEDALALTDETGRTVEGELRRIGFLGPAEPRLADVHAYVEVHIEQGPILEAEGMDLGVVTGVQAISWQEVSIRGRSAHAGTTPMELRSDAMLAVTRVHTELDRMIRSGEFGADFRATIGRVDLVPNRVNIVPGRATITIDLRNPEDEAMTRAQAHLAGFLSSLEASLGAQIEARQTARTSRIHFSEDVQSLLARKMDDAGLRHRRILSGAGHDAQEMSAICSTAMIFVPGLYDGISHNPREYSTPTACTRGVQILFDSILELSAS